MIYSNVKVLRELKEVTSCVMSLYCTKLESQNICTTFSEFITHMGGAVLIIEWCNPVLYALACTIVIFMRLEFRDALHEDSNFLLCTSV
jgi:hypothetical protein